MKAATETIQELASLVRFHRSKSGLTQKELANLAGVGKTAVFDIEKGKNTVRLDTLARVLTVLNISLELTSPLVSAFAAQSVKEEKP